MRLKKTGAVLAMSLWLVGCVSMAPAYHVPALPVPDQYQGHGAEGAEINADLMAWQTYFTDPALQQLIQAGLAHNRDLRIAALRVAEARAAYGIQRAESLPQFDIAGNGNRQRVPGDLNVSGQTQYGSQYTVGVGLSAWEVDFWGRIRSLNQAALAQYLASEANQQAVMVSLIGQVADGYYGLTALDERIDLAAKAIASHQESVRIFTRRYQVGSGSKMDLTQVQTLLAQAQALHSQLQQQRDAQIQALQVLVGMDSPLPEATRFSLTSLPSNTPVGLPSNLLTRRPDIMAAEYRLQGANANIGAARAAFFPRLALTGQFGSASADLNGLFDSGSQAWSFMPTLSVPIFHGGRLRANVDMAQIRKDVAIADYEKTIQQAFREVSDGLNNIKWLQNQVTIQGQALAAQAETARLAQLSYDYGAVNFLSVLDAQRNLLSAEQQLVQVKRSLMSAKIALYMALGGG